ncbi:Hypp7995 [Branchiostoma lanceolatum]|uniref:Hypp7995 protein n=1 Tax=Branchiostoma lanceolatum TaxID=7740 RepID=A0A8J9Z4Y9_BRALA|nr:Hypp7995 [Branchiostoma lanceolatum]
MSPRIWSKHLDRGVGRSSVFLREVEPTGETGGGEFVGEGGGSWAEDVIGGSPLDWYWYGRRRSSQLQEQGPSELQQGPPTLREQGPTELQQGPPELQQDPNELQQDPNELRQDPNELQQ